MTPVLWSSVCAMLPILHRQDRACVVEVRYTVCVHLAYHLEC